ncbi:hypothetical protein CA54_57010 [Symmachiella macrocystis]|uniref:Uncharacterized protein n=1 Tax=Symmachiella macrocystis TaxID=2527985 RepID=A0A5C6B7M2_9PLAN|nr:hypothetical protein CA54_57010 [Symmachiella macrocystis]
MWWQRLCHWSRKHKTNSKFPSRVWMSWKFAQVGATPLPRILVLPAKSQSGPNKGLLTEYGPPQISSTRCLTT